jgi:hypothetical protein
MEERDCVYCIYGNGVYRVIRIIRVIKVPYGKEDDAYNDLRGMTGRVRRFV